MIFRKLSFKIGKHYNLILTFKLNIIIKISKIITNTHLKSKLYSHLNTPSILKMMI